MLIQVNKKKTTLENDWMIIRTKKLDSYVLFYFIVHNLGKLMT
ncbi:hypothetical protein GCM10025857_62330 [Alicyclobacillus contaminans]|uniref:Uncharacterized protein n=1 Tax=Tetragenococcus osmophilus TaxID=526944 RepID=A0AA37XIM1_9ENTE|nr:hypothetical protein GCM10025857_62330 [Alicyclobacillus contaminans]GMA71325.1 hypothetical protein GCM10025885_03740 [Tetragenococcus osmophilus]